MSYKLFLDDIRNVTDVTWGNFQEIFGLPDNVVTVRNYEQFVAAITNAGLPTVVSFDHDLAEEHYRDAIMLFDKADSYKEKTGYDCAKFLFEYCLAHRLSLPKCNIHSMNPVGAQRIYDLLASYDKTFRAMHG
jgi:hypothetical protein